MYKILLCSPKERNQMFHSSYLSLMWCRMIKATVRTSPHDPSLIPA